MEPGNLAEFIGVTILMVFWLGFVAISAILAIRKTKISEGLRKKQFFYLGLATVIVFIGDLIHTIGFDISIASGDPKGIINLSTWGSIESHTLSLFIDGLAFVFYYAMWIFVLSFRYQEGKLFLYDKITLGIASFSMLTALFSPYIAIPGIDYVITVYSLHMLSFVIFGLMVVGKLIYMSNKARKINSQYQAEEKLLFISGWGFVASFTFFILTLALLPLDSKFGLLMIPKTLAYMVSFGAIIKLLYSKN